MWAVFVFPPRLGRRLTGTSRQPDVRPRAFSNLLSGSYQVLAPHSVAKADGFG